MTPRAFALLLLAMAVHAQTPPATSPNFVWEGSVDQAAVLYLRGDHLEVANPRGGPVRQQRYRFFHLTPNSRQQVRLEVLEGRGSVQITQQPTLENDYTITIGIEDRQEGRAHYSIALYWDAPADDTQQGARKWSDPGWRGDDVAPEPKAHMVRLRWRGHVEADAIVECHASECHSQVTRGMPVSHEQVRFDQPLPQQEVAVSLAGDNAGGAIRVLQQPMRSNAYTVRVGLADGCAGRKECRFTLEWREPVPGARQPPQTPHRGLAWSGRVSGTVSVTVRGSSTLSGVVEGGSLANEQTIFDRPLPHRADLSPTIRKVQGRGTVAIVESPSQQNGFSLVFEVRDPGPGADDYTVELGW
jgi:hypothetical protein